MRIGLLAPEVSGKTSYLVALYGELTDDRTLSPDTPLEYACVNSSDEGWFNDALKKLTDDRLPMSDRLPDKTVDRVKEYGLSCINVARKSSEAITFIDFPGELLRGFNCPDDKEIYLSFLLSLSSCDAFIIILDSSIMTEGGLGRVKGALTPQQMYKIISSSLDGYSARRFTTIGVPVCFCISKLDLIDNLDQDHSYKIDLAYERVKKVFPSFFSASHHHPVMVTGVSLGQDIDPDPKGGPDRIGGPFEPFNIGTPLDFCLSFGALSAAAHSEGQAQNHDHLESDYQKRADEAGSLGMLDTIKEWFLSDASIGQSPAEKYKYDRQMHENLASRSRKSTNDLTDISRISVDNLCSIYDDGGFKVFYDGKKQVFSRDITVGKIPLREE